MQRYLSSAAKAAKKSIYRYRLGAVVIKNRKIISSGYNKTKSHPLLFKDYDFYSIHAECDAILRASGGDTLVVVRIRKDGSLATSKPCYKCKEFIRDSGIKRIIYVDQHGEPIEERI